MTSIVENENVQEVIDHISYLLQDDMPKNVRERLSLMKEELHRSQDISLTAHELRERIIELTDSHTNMDMTLRSQLFMLATRLDDL